MFNDEELKKIEIDINKDVSDIVLNIQSEEPGQFFYNLMTGKRSDVLQDVIRRGTRFILRSYWPYAAHFKEEHINNYSASGMYVYHDKERNVLFNIFATLDCHGGNRAWEERERFWFYVGEDGMMRRGSSNEASEEFTYSIGEFSLDICGQAMMPVMFKKIVADDIYSADNVCAGAKEALDSFIGGMYELYKNEITRYDTYFACTSLRAINFAAKNPDGHIFGRGFLEGNKFKKKEEDALPKLPQKAHKVMEDIIRDSIYQTAPCTESTREMRLCCLQRVGDEVWLHQFVPDIIYGNPVTASKITMSEHIRIRLGQKYKEACQRPSNIADDLVVYMDGDLKGTPFEYLAGPVKEWLRMVDIIMHRYSFVGLSEELSRAHYDFKDRYGYYSVGAVNFMEILASHPLLEKLWRQGREFPTNYMEKCAIDMIKNMDSAPDSFINNKFGQLVKNTGAPHEMIGVPKAMLQLVLRTGSFYRIREAKEIFSSCGMLGYMKNFNEEDCGILLEALKYEDTSEILKLLFLWKGCRSWRAYIRYLDNVVFSLRGYYKNYLMAVIGLGEMAKTAEWKLRPDTIRDRCEEICRTYKMTQNDAKMRFINSMFKMQQDKWKQYRYRKGEYFIAYPEEGEDIIQEGVVLHHCVKGFLETVAYGNTTILFIRKTDEPYKPFYTLEVKANAIRQCHGFDNRNIGTEPGLREFLQDFCFEKGIAFREGTGRFGI